MKVRIGTAVLAIAVLGVAHSALAQVQPPQDQINKAIARAQQVGIPVALLESKVAEGKAKGISMDRIAAAVTRREAALERASQAIAGQRGTATPADLSVAADAVESGVSDAVLKAVAETTPRERRAVAIAALTQLVQLGHAPEAALAQVQEALKRGPDALLNLAAEAGRRGAPPSGQPPSAVGGRRGASAGPPASAPAPGGGSQPSRPGAKPTTPGGPSTTPGAKPTTPGAQAPTPGPPTTPGPGAGRGGA
jgi:hypothetical protein